MTVALSMHAAAHLLEQVGGEELKVVGGAGGVAGDLDLDNLVIILDNVKLNLELADESVLVDPVNTDLHVSLPLVEDLVEEGKREWLGR